MSVIPVPEASPPSEPPQTPTPQLRLVTHEHMWQLRSIEYDDAFEVRCYECTECDGVMYR